MAGNNAMQLPGQTMPGNTAQGGLMLRLAQSQGSAILQTPQAFGGSAQQAPQMQGGVGVLTQPGQGGAASTTLDTLDKFLEAKYNHSREFNREYFLLNGYTNAIADAEIFPIVTFGTYKEFASEVEEKILGITISNGIEIESYATHFINRVIGQFADSHRGTRRGTPIADVMDTLLNPVHIKPPVRMSLPDSKESKSRREDVRQKFIGKNATVVISTTDNRLVQANPYSE